MGTNLHSPTVPQKALQQFIQAAVQNIVFLPRRCDQNTRPVTAVLFHRHICLVQAVQLTVSAYLQLFRRQAFQFLAFANLRNLEFSDTQNLIVMIQCTGMEYHVGAERIMEHVDILYVFPDIASLVMVIFQIRHRHYDNIRIHFHHQGYEPALSDIICLQFLIGF